MSWTPDGANLRRLHGSALAPDTMLMFNLYSYRTSSQKPGDELLATFRQQFPEVAAATTASSAAAAPTRTATTSQAGQTETVVTSQERCVCILILLSIPFLLAFLSPFFCHLL